MNSRQRGTSVRFNGAWLSIRSAWQWLLAVLYWGTVRRWREWHCPRHYWARIGPKMEFRVCVKCHRTEQIGEDWAWKRVRI